ncbi:MAG: hypothetical protein KAV87_02195 [Desulfobacteraceae bacterium]|nr:hypothetical protein [Desulfobacteraceae bacterium]
MAKKIRVEVNTKELQKVMKSLTDLNGLRVKVGVLSKNNARPDSKVGESNASIGAVHEYGSYSRNIPQRSFIKMPLTMKSEELVKEIKRLMQTSLENHNIVPLLTNVGNAAEGIIHEAFDSGGFGMWQPIGPATAERKMSEAILIDKAHLQMSIMSAVVGGSKNA